MAKFVALLRGINVGKANRLPMAELRTMLEALGFTQVRTLLNSGNAVFDAPKGTALSLSKLIATAITERFGFELPVIVKSDRQLRNIIADNPIAADPPQHSRLMVAFVQDARALKDVAAIGPLVVAPEQFVVGRDAAYLLCARGILESKAANALLGRAGRTATSRNWATVLRLAAL